MTRIALPLPGDSQVPDLAREVATSGGRLLVVGGWVRDALRGEETKDFDLEVFGLAESAITRLLTPHGFSPPVGRQFAVWRSTRAGIDVAMPREGQTEFSSGGPGALESALKAAARHRDLTVNAIAWDPVDGQVYDAYGGREDLAAGRLRAVDSETFGADPLRVMRVARLAGRLGAQPDAALKVLCQSLDLSRLPVERLAEEVRRALVECPRPSIFIETLHILKQLSCLAPVAALEATPQDPRWHPEGDVLIHTAMVIDQAATLARTLSEEDAEILLWAALCHDLGKPATTVVDGERVRAHGHEGEGAKITEAWLQSLRIGTRQIAAVVALVAHHLAPGQFISQGAGPRAYRRLARKLAVGGVTSVDLERLARADHLGRTTEEARAGVFPAGDAFLAAAEAARVRLGVVPDVVSAARVMQRGIPAGPELGRILARCRERQDETGENDPETLLTQVLNDGSPRA